MLKRIISGVLAAVLLFLSIPVVSFADDTVDIDTWLSALFTKCLEAGNGKGGIDSNNNVTLGMDLISVQTMNDNIKLTLCPIIESKGNYTFPHAVLKTTYKSGNKDKESESVITVECNDTTFKDSLTGYKDDIVALGSAAPGCRYNEKYGDGNTDNGVEHYRYGTIGAIISNNNGLDTSGLIANKYIIINPVYIWADIHTSDKEYAGIDNVDNGDAAASTYIYAMNKAKVDKTKEVVSNYWVDPLSVYLFISKIHMLYHTPSVWTALGYDAKECKSMEGCEGRNCPLVKGMTMYTSKGTYGNTDGEHGGVRSASILLSYYRTTNKENCRNPELDLALNYTFTRIYNFKSKNVSYGNKDGFTTLSDLAPSGDTSVIAEELINKMLNSEHVNNMEHFSEYVNGCKSDIASKYIYGYLDSMLKKNNMSLSSQNDGKELSITDFQYNVINEMLSLIQTTQESTVINRTLVLNGNSELKSGNTYIGEIIVNAINDFLGTVDEFRKYAIKAEETAEKHINANNATGEFKVGDRLNLQVSMLSRVLVSTILHVDGTNENEILLSDWAKFMTLQYPGSDFQYSSTYVRQASTLNNKSNILAGLALALNTTTYEEFKEEFMPIDSWEALHDENMFVWSRDTNKTLYKEFIHAFPMEKGKEKVSRDEFINSLLANAVLTCYHDNNLDESKKLLFLHTLWNKLYAVDNNDKSIFFPNSKPTFTQIDQYWTTTGSATIASSAQIEQYLAQYDLAEKCAMTSIKGAETLGLRSEIIDFYIKYNLPEDELLKKIKEKCEEQYKAIQGEGSFMSNLGNDYLAYEPMNSTTAGDLYIYQQEIVYEACYYGEMIYLSLILDVLSNGVTLEGNGKYISMLSDFKMIHDKYRGAKTDDFWYNPGMAEKAENEKNAEFESSKQKEYLDTLAGLYDYLVAMGLITSASYTVDIYDEQDPITLFWTQVNGNITFSKDYYTGRALSATFIPMQTNVYDPYTMLDYVDTEWIEDFHYKYGFYRKALLIDTNVDAAVDSYISNTQGETRVATLQDLFNCESDIVLYIDEHFYGLSELVELQNKTYDRLASTNPDMFQQIANSISDMFSMFREVDFDIALKHKVNTYSQTIENDVSGMDFVLDQNEDGSWVMEPKKYDQYILTPDTIKEYIKSDEYTPMLGYAVVSNIYRNNDAFVTTHNVAVTRTPVFESSPTLATISGTSDTAKNTLYNYALLKNISAMTTVGYETSTDMTSPIYCDIYGNIVTESGLVIIPAACNATLHNGSSTWQPISTGFLSTYGKEWSIPTSWNLDEDFMVKMFYKNEELGIWEIRNKTIQNMEINFAQLSYADKAVNVALKEWYNYDLVNGSQINQYNSLNILHEVLRGAPLENIDFDAENLNSARKVDKSGLIAAAKLDNIVNSLDWDDENSIMSIPRLSFIDNYQYIVVFIFKVLLVIVVTALMITIYVDVLKTKISWRTLGRCVMALVLGVACVLLIPVSYDISYYQSNKLLLQDEAEYIMMLNTEKNMSGREIGVYEVTEPEQHTQILIKLEDFEFNWLEVLPSVITSDSINVMDAKYKEFLNNSLLANKDNVQAMNDGMYMDVQDIFDTSVLNFSTTSKQLYQKVSVDPVASYYIPYYYFLDALLTNMNDFNRSNNVYAYSTKIMRGGAVKTVNLCSAYFNSKEFMESNDSDYLGLYQLYETMGSMIILPIFNEESIESARQSQWFVGTLIPEEDVLARLELMDTKVKQFIMENKNLIGKVTDETFLKCMAMDLAIEYNNIFGIPSANAFEVYNLSNADLMRLTIADKASTLEGSPMSFSRFVYNEAGTPGVYASVFLVITTMFVQTMKTIITIAIMVLLIISVFVFKILLRKSNNSIAGYLLTLLVICSTNILYAVILKVSLAIPQTGLAPTLCIIIQIIVQLAYLWVLTVVLGFALRDWKNIGFTKYQTIGHNIKEKFSRRHSRSPKDRYDSQPRGVDGWEYYRKLVKENEQRMKKVGTH